MTMNDFEIRHKVEVLNKDAKSYLMRRTKFDFINEFEPEFIAHWVMMNHLNDFCKDMKYAKWVAEKKRILGDLVMEEL